MKQRRGEMDPETLRYARMKGRLKFRLYRERHPDASRAYHREWMRRKRLMRKATAGGSTPLTGGTDRRAWMRTALRSALNRVAARPGAKGGA